VTLVTFCAPRAYAAGPGQSEQQPSFGGEQEEVGVARPMPPDQRTGHIYLAGSFGAIGPVGAVGPLVPTQSVAGVGYDFGATLGVGIGRHSVLQVYGNRTVFTPPANCNEGCSGLSYALGLGVVYHLLQGIAVDPWGSFGMGYRTETFSVVAPGFLTTTNNTVYYKGFDVARIAFGGDFYPVPWLGLGPFVEADVGTNLHTQTLTSQGTPAPPVTLPPNVTDAPRTYGFFQVGIRIALDPMRHGSLPRAKAVGISSSTPGM
jgi:hypothetical protein